MTRKALHPAVADAANRILMSIEATLDYAHTLSMRHGNEEATSTLEDWHDDTDRLRDLLGLPPDTDETRNSYRAYRNDNGEVEAALD